MPGFLLHVGASILCAHAGQAQPLTSNPRVKVSGQPVVTRSTPYVIAGCTLPPPPAANGPCLTAQWLTAATRVRVSGEPVLLQDSQAVAAPAGTPLLVVTIQSRVKGV